MNSRITLLAKNFNKNLLIGSSCLLLQGCATWFQPSTSKENITPESTTIETQKDSLETSESLLLKDELAETTKVGQQHLRALPLRPKKIEEIEIEVEEEIEDVATSSVKDAVMYTVQKGDTVSLIAKKFHVNLNQLVTENHLVNKNKLFIGQVLSIPANGIDSNENYVVQKGDSLSSIASKFNTTVDKIRDNNHLKSDVIFVGQKLSLGSEKVSVAATIPQVTPIDTEKYVVQNGDILWNIARRCGMSVKQLMEINHITNPKNLRVGQVLYVKAQPVQEEIPTTISEQNSDANKAEEETGVTTSSNLLDNLESFMGQSEKNQEVKSLEEDNFEDLFDETSDIPVIPLDEIK